MRRQLSRFLPLGKVNIILFGVVPIVLKQNMHLYGFRSEEAIILAERLSDLRAKFKLWGAQTKIIAQAEVQVLLQKVDAANNQVSRLETKFAETQEHIQALHVRRQDLLLPLGKMVPVSELIASQAEASKLHEDIRCLNQLLQIAQRETEDLKTSNKV